MSEASQAPKRIRFSKFTAVATGAVIAALGLVGIGGYALGATGSQVIHACYEKKAPHTFIKDTKCPSGYTPLQWNVTGPAGPSTVGPSGLDVTWILGPVETSTGGFTYFDAKCPTSMPYVVGGGYFAPYATLVVIDRPLIEPNAPEYWQVQVSMPDSDTGQAYALCSKLSGRLWRATGHRWPST